MEQKSELCLAFVKIRIFLFFVGLISYKARLVGLEHKPTYYTYMAEVFLFFFRLF